MSRSEETLEDLSLSRGSLDRSDLAGEGDALRRALGDADTRVLDLVADRTRACRVDGAMRLVYRAPTVADADRMGLYLGRDDERHAYVAVVRDPDADDTPDTSSQGWNTLREVGDELDDTSAAAFTVAMALRNWHLRHPRCPRCGAATQVLSGGWLRRCEQDGSEHHPRTDAAVIMAITDEEDRLLLARGPHWPPGRMSVLAGFVEAGESFEAAVQREVSEEVGLAVSDITYQGNQPWPFPASLMVAFTARTQNPAFALDDDEIVEAAWFTRGELAGRVRTGETMLPPRVSIARRLIEGWYGRELEQPDAPPGPYRGLEQR